MAKLRTILYIESDKDDFKIDLIKKLLPINPSDIRQKGEPMIVNGIQKNRPNLRSCWKYEATEKDVKDIKEGLIPLLEYLMPYKNIFNEIKHKYGFEMYISLVLHIKDMEKPAMSLNNVVISSLNDLGLELDFDIYYE